MRTIELTLPVHWASPLVNDDDTGLDDIEQAQLDKFIADMVDEHGKCYCIDAKLDDTTFFKYHDANSYGVLACDCAIFVFEA
tara:strand:- start:2654 stop:2899 length:246 start_codon:yes stop_codon:yes gene_type:complete